MSAAAGESKSNLHTLKKISPWPAGPRNGAEPTTKETDDSFFLSIAFMLLSCQEICCCPENLLCRFQT